MTEFEFRLHPLGPQVLAGQMAFPAERAPHVLPRWRAWADAVRPLRDLGPALDRVGPMPYTAFQAILDAFAPRGFRSYARGE